MARDVGPGLPQGRFEERGVGVVDGPGSERGAGLGHLVAGGEQQHAEAGADTHRPDAAGREEPQLGGAEQRARRQGDLALGDVAARPPHEQPGVDAAGQADGHGARRPVRRGGELRRVGTFDGHDGGRPLGQHGAGHDRRGGARREGPRHGAGGDGVGHGQRGHGLEVVGVDGVPVHLRVVEGRQAHRRAHVLGEGAALGVDERQDLRCAAVVSAAPAQEAGDGGPVFGDGSSHDCLPLMTAFRASAGGPVAEGHGDRQVV
ncbi:hypothetical protein QFZ50_000695 [Arthrobacter agilis]|nr:hypothetical protein [Arthrobacter agilis]